MFKRSFCSFVACLAMIFLVPAARAEYRPAAWTPNELDAKLAVRTHEFMQQLRSDLAAKGIAPAAMKSCRNFTAPGQKRWFIMTGADMNDFAVFAQRGLYPNGVTVSAQQLDAEPDMVYALNCLGVTPLVTFDTMLFERLPSGDCGSWTTQVVPDYDRVFTDWRARHPGLSPKRYSVVPHTEINNACIDTHTLDPLDQDLRAHVPGLYITYGFSINPAGKLPQDYLPVTANDFGIFAYPTFDPENGDAYWNDQIALVRSRLHPGQKWFAVTRLFKGPAETIPDWQIARIVVNWASYMLAHWNETSGDCFFLWNTVQSDVDGGVLTGGDKMNRTVMDALRWAQRTMATGKKLAYPSWYRPAPS